MTVTPEPNLDRLNRRTWTLWALAFSVIIALTIAVPVLYLPALAIVSAYGLRGTRMAG